MGTLGSNTASVQKQSINLAIEHFTIMKVAIILLVFLVAFTNAASVKKDDDKYCNGLAKKCRAGDQDACDLYKKKCGKDDDKYCDGLAKKCKSGDKDACDLYKKKCAKEVGYELNKKCQELYDSIPHCDDDYCDAKDDEFDTDACCDCWNMLCYLYPNKCDKCKPNRWC